MSDFIPRSVFNPEFMASVCVYRSQRQGGKGGGGEGRDAAAAALLWCMVSALLLPHSLNHLIPVTA